jgi:hypothetical protein
MVSPSPISIIDKATKEVPATKYALAVGAVVAVVAVILGFKINLLVATLGAVVMLVLMTAFVFFANLAAQSEKAKTAVTFRHQISAFAWFCLLLIMATALGVFSSAFWKWPLNFGTLTEGSPEVTLKNKIDDLESDRPSLGNTWTAYEADYGRIADITRSYAHYIEENPDADVGDKILTSIQDVANHVRGRNSDESAYGSKRPDPVFYTKTLPGVFDRLLGDLKRAKHNGKGLTLEQGVCFDTGIRRWLASAWFDGAPTTKLLKDSGFANTNTPPVMSKECLDYLQLKPEELPIEK